MIMTQMGQFTMEDSADREPFSENEISQLRVTTTVRLCNLPLFNQGAIKLLTIASADDGAMAEFETVFRSDPGLAAELLLLANSGAFGFRARISSIGRALQFIGLERSRSLASRIAMSFYLRTSSRKEVQAVWSHSIATAVLAEHIGVVTGRPMPILFTAGLLHDVGTLGLFLTSRGQYPELIALKLADVEEASRIETLLWGVSHTEAGAVLADAWGFPASLRRCISDHHGDVSASDDPLLSVVQLACGLASSLGYAEAFVAAGGRTAVLPPDLARRPELAPELLQDLITTQMALSR